MNLIIVLLYSISIIAIKFVSTAVRENKLYAISANDSDNSFQVTSYELKDGSIKDIFSNGISSSLTKLGRGFELKFFDIPNTLQEYRDKLWLKADQTSADTKTSNTDSNFMGYINLNDLSFKRDTSFIEFPKDENFPVFGYTMNTITNERESALYITGGVIYSKSKDAYISSNSFFKYNFATKKWDDMTSGAKGKLNPVYNHTSVVADKTLVLIGGRVAKDPTKDSTLNVSEDGLFKINSIYNLTKFDTVTNNWKLTEFSANFYSNKVYTLGGSATSNEKQAPDRNTKLGILDYNGNQWSWSPVFDDAGNIFNSPVEAKSSLIFNDQIILTSGKNVEKG
ncbi:hypothetical protein CONCODRAFT_12617 [Conidiobolus coronatus NRRL 28638]|uniref:Galactose oxidase n=1 Tax=Conidiobolus coronatus (strain ATCC 28846 / CBS 209.66 / NRRL 28638) TaxID=796925 RepID=A0A137NSG2_CONC2|nr:hypothetical protein CONCODRAFT_12617 [Conidiobolus coronatus NRRL 28638]|eukprot:KXN65713.1 hypothetical protein CONCODRAFT_12617 [Conidiobolus coronatus NRRL 28638]